MPRSRLTPWPYSKAADGSIHCDPIQWAMAKRLLDLFLESKGRLSATLESWEKQGAPPLPFAYPIALKRWLVHPALRRHEPVLITPELHSQIETLLRCNRKLWGHNASRSPRLLTGLVVCAGCGVSMRYAGGRKFPSLLCQKESCPQRYRSIQEAQITAAIAGVIEGERRALEAQIQELMPKPGQLPSVRALSEIQQWTAQLEKRLKVLEDSSELSFHQHIEQIKVADREVIEVRWRAFTAA